MHVECSKLYRYFHWDITKIGVTQSSASLSQQGKSAANLLQMFSSNLSISREAANFETAHMFYPRLFEGKSLIPCFHKASLAQDKQTLQ